MSRHVQPCRYCGRRIQLVLVIPGRLVPGRKRRYVPLELTFDPADGVEASHALSTGRTTCHPITAENPLLGDEHPALTHFAVCPARRLSTTPSAVRSSS